MDNLVNIIEAILFVAGDGVQYFDIADKLEISEKEVKNAVEEIFDVKVVKINIMNVKGKLKRQGRYEGYTKRRRKAIVTLSADSNEIKLFNDNNEN